MLNFLVDWSVSPSPVGPLFTFFALRAVLKLALDGRVGAGNGCVGIGNGRVEVGNGRLGVGNWLTWG